VERETGLEPVAGPFKTARSYSGTTYLGAPNCTQARPGRGQRRGQIRLDGMPCGAPLAIHQTGSSLRRLPRLRAKRSATPGSLADVREERGADLGGWVRSGSWDSPLSGVGVRCPPRCALD